MAKSDLTDGASTHVTNEQAVRKISDIPPNNAMCRAEISDQRRKKKLPQSDVKVPAKLNRHINYLNENGRQILNCSVR